MQQISAEAYAASYVIGVVPKPATEDYPRALRGEVWLLEAEQNPIGLIVLEQRGLCPGIDDKSCIYGRETKLHGNDLTANRDGGSAAGALP